MGRMDRYEEDVETTFSRTQKNEGLYNDIYLNNTLINLSEIMDDEVLELDETSEEVFEFKKVEYVEKDYDINKYLQEKRLLRVKDNLPRALDEEIKKNEDEINELVSKIEQKEKEEDLFNELMPDDENTAVLEAQDDKLDSVVSDDVINNFVMNKDLDETNSFMDLDETKIIEQKKEKKKNPPQNPSKKKQREMEKKNAKKNAKNVVKKAETTEVTETTEN